MESLRQSTALQPIPTAGQLMGPPAKEPATAIFIAALPFGYEVARYCVSGFGMKPSPHMAWAVRDSRSLPDPAGSLQLQGIPTDIRRIANIITQKRTKSQSDRLKKYFLTHYNPNRKLKKRISAIEKQQAASFPETMIMQDMAKPRATHVLSPGTIQ